MREIPDIYFTFIGQVEGDVLTAMKDSGDKWTIGRGHTGPEVREGMTISEDESKHLCEADSHIAMDRLYAATRDDELLDDMPPAEFSALLAFVYNVGADPKWTIWQDLRAGNLTDIPTQLVRFDKIKHADGTIETVPGLLNRRVAEVHLWNRVDPTVAAAVVAAAPVAPPPSSVTRDAVTPPAPSSPHVPAIQSKTRWAAAAVTLVGLASALQTFLQSAQQSVDGSGFHFTWMPTFDHLAGVIVAGLGIGITVIRALDEQAKSQ